MYSLSPGQVGRREVILTGDPSYSHSEGNSVPHAYFRNRLPREVFARGFQLKFLQLPTNFNDQEAISVSFPVIFNSSDTNIKEEGKSEHLRDRFIKNHVKNIEVFPLHVLHVNIFQNDVLPDTPLDGTLRFCPESLVNSPTILLDGSLVPEYDNLIPNQDTSVTARNTDNSILVENFLAFETPSNISVDTYLNFFSGSGSNTDPDQFARLFTTFTAERLVYIFNISIWNFLSYDRDAHQSSELSSFMVVRDADGGNGLEPTADVRLFNPSLRYQYRSIGDKLANTGVTDITKIYRNSLTNEDIFSHLTLNYDGKRNIFQLNYGFEWSKFALPGVRWTEANLVQLPNVGHNSFDYGTLADITPINVGTNTIAPNYKIFDIFENLLMTVDTYLITKEPFVNLLTANEKTSFVNDLGSTAADIQPYFISIREWREMTSTPELFEIGKEFLLRVGNQLNKRFGLGGVDLCDLTHYFDYVPQFTEGAFFTSQTHLAPKPAILISGEVHQGVGDQFAPNHIYYCINKPFTPKAGKVYISCNWFYSNYDTFVNETRLKGYDFRQQRMDLNSFTLDGFTVLNNSELFSRMGFLNSLYTSAAGNGIFAKEFPFHTVAREAVGLEIRLQSGATGTTPQILKYIALRTVLFSGSLKPQQPLGENMYGDAVNPDFNADPNVADYTHDYYEPPTFGSQFIFRPYRVNGANFRFTMTEANENLQYINQENVLQRIEQPLYFNKEKLYVADPAAAEKTSIGINNHRMDLPFYMSNLIPPYLKFHCREISQASLTPTLVTTEMTSNPQAKDQKIQTLVKRNRDQWTNAESLDQTIISVIPLDTAWAGGEDTLKSNILTYQPSFDRSQIIPLRDSTFREFTWWLTDDHNQVLQFPRQKPVVDIFFVD